VNEEETGMEESFSELAGGLDHPECAAWGPDGYIYAGGEAGQIYRIGLEGNVEEIASTGGFIFGLALDADANVYACDFGKGEVARITPNGEVSSYSRGTVERPMSIPNFAAFDREGNLFVTDSGTWGTDSGAIFRIRPAGATEVWSTDVPAFPNGCCLTLDGSALLVVESRARRIVRISFEPDGSAGTPETVADLAPSQPDGIALAEDGTMFAGCYRPDLIWRIPPGGAPEVFAEDPDGVELNQPANVAFVGKDRRRIVVSSLGGWSLMTAAVDVTGASLRYPRL